jgi:hypothetical protein
VALRCTLRRVVRYIAQRGCFDLFCSVCVCVCVGCVMCECFGNVCTCIYCVLYYLYCVFYCLVYVYIVVGEDFKVRDVFEIILVGGR